jgi:2-oxoisovalerate dehydrogenase E1 component
VPAAVEVIDLRTVVPWDRETVFGSVKKTSKLLIVHEDIACAGFGAEIAATIAAELFHYLDAPVRRLAAPSVPIPYSPTLMHAVVPSSEQIREQMADLVAF